MKQEEARKLAQRFGVRMCDENGMTHGEELYCLGLDDIISMKEALASEQELRNVSEDTRRAWVGLTYDERVSIICEDENRSLLEHCERIEATLKEKNTRNGGCL